MGCKYRVMDKCRAEDNKDAFCFGNDGCPYYEEEVKTTSQADYNARLKADMVAMLIDLKNELTDISWNIDMYDSDLDFECCYLNDIGEVIDKKISELEGKDNDSM